MSAPTCAGSSRAPTSPPGGCGASGPGCSPSGCSRLGSTSSLAPQSVRVVGGRGRRQVLWGEVLGIRRTGARACLEGLGYITGSAFFAMPALTRGQRRAEPPRRRAQVPRTPALGRPGTGYAPRARGDALARCRPGQSGMAGYGTSFYSPRAAQIPSRDPPSSARRRKSF